MEENTYKVTPVQKVVIDNVVKRYEEAMSIRQAINKDLSADELLAKSDSILELLAPVSEFIRWAHDNAKFIEIAAHMHDLVSELKDLAIEQQNNPVEKALKAEGCSFSTESIGDLCEQAKFNEAK